MLCAAPYSFDALHRASPGEAQERIRVEIRGELDRHDVRVGYGCPVVGPGLIFCEELIARAGELHLVLPCPAAAFISDHLQGAGEGWVDRFQAVCAQATRIEVSCEERLVGDETVLRFNNQMLQGMARIHADRIGGRARLLATWSPSAPAAPGSPADFIDQWPELEHLSLIDLDEMGSQAGSLATDDLLDGLDALAIGASPLVVRAIIFADLATYSLIGDDQIPLLWDFLAEVQNGIENSAKAPLLINTWGDAIHAATDTAIDLAGYASALVGGTARLDPAVFGLKTRPRFRVALHAGPVYVGLHPLTGRSMIFGHHVNRAARIEGIAEPGEIYASQHFVALLRAEMDGKLHEARQGGGSYRPEYVMDYVGMMDLPKKFGREAIYRIKPVLDVDG